jgi:hypothetical protein
MYRPLPPRVAGESDSAAQNVTIGMKQNDKTLDRKIKGQKHSCRPARCIGQRRPQIHFSVPLFFCRSFSYCAQHAPHKPYDLLTAHFNPVICSRKAKESRQKLCRADTTSHTGAVVQTVAFAINWQQHVVESSRRLRMSTMSVGHADWLGAVTRISGIMNSLERPPLVNRGIVVSPGNEYDSAHFLGEALEFHGI